MPTGILLAVLILHDVWDQQLLEYFLWQELLKCLIVACQYRFVDLFKYSLSEITLAKVNCLSNSSWCSTVVFECFSTAVTL